MNVVVVTPRAGPFIDLALAKSHLRVEHGDHDVLIGDYVEACATWLDGPTGILGLSVGPQTLRAERIGFPGGDGFELPCGPVQTVEGIGYVDWTGTAQTVLPDVYELNANRVLLAQGQAWPSGACSPVSVTYVAGYASGDLPAAIRQAALLHLKILYDQPDDKSLAALERSRDDLLAPFRKRRV